MRKEIDPYEQGLTVKYRRKLWSRFVKAIKEYDMIQTGDKICVCISGGKDSMIMAKLFQLLHSHTSYQFEVEYVVMNPGYDEANLNQIRINLEKLHIPAKIIETDIFDIANQQVKSPCFLCAKMRRGALYNIAKKLGCNKIALGHHYDDVIETTLMNLLNAGSFQTMLPKLHSTNYEGMELIRPMYYIREQDIISFRNTFDLTFIACACKLTKSYQETGTGSQRAATKKLIHDLLKYNDQVELNLFKAPDNVTLDMIQGYNDEGGHHSYYDHYETNGVVPELNETKKPTD